jgi:hypothetical protein
MGVTTGPIQHPRRDKNSVSRIEIAANQVKSHPIGIGTAANRMKSNPIGEGFECSDIKRATDQKKSNPIREAFKRVSEDRREWGRRMWTH